MPPERYLKRALVIDDQIDLVVGRGLSVPDRVYATRWLRHVSYYRLSAYMLPFKDPGTDTFLAGATFDQVTELYKFDRRLRLILLEAIERIEVALRAYVTYELALSKGPFAHADPGNFAQFLEHQEMMNEIAVMERDSRETFVKHYREKYEAEPHLPIWMATELISFGRLSRMFSAIEPALKKKFARRFDVAEKYVQSWAHVLSYVRNVCAHHCRLWNRALSIKPKLPGTARNWPYAQLTNERLYCVLVILRHSLVRLYPRNRWHERLFSLFDDYPRIPLREMGIPDGWRQQMPWI